MRGETIDQPRVAGVDLLASEPALLPGNRDQPEAARTEHHRHIGDHLLGRTVRIARLTQPCRRLGAPGLGVGVAGRRHAAQVGDELLQRLPRAVLEGRALCLTVVRQHDDLVRPGGPPDGTFDATDLAVEVAQHGERVDSLRTRMMGDLVVAEHVDIDRRASFAHVVDHALHRHVAGDDGGERAQQRVAPAAFDPRLAHPTVVGAWRLPVRVRSRRSPRSTS